MIAGDRGAALHDLVVEALAPAVLEVVDESHMHSRGAQSHFKLVVVADGFAGQTLVARHRAVHAAAAPLLQPGGIHALAIHAYTVQEWTQRGGAVPASPPCRGGSKHERSPG